MLIAQITDAHIVEKGTHWLSEPLTKTHERLAHAISYLNAMHPAPDVVLFTGDAVDDGRREAYEHLVELLSSLKIPYFILPGNHDSREEMRKAFFGKPYMPSTGFLQYVVDDYPVRLIALDTHVEKESLGKICEDRLNWLEKTLNAETSKPTLIFMHHPPVKTGTKVFDRITCFYPEYFENLIREKNNILGIVTGHYHHFCLSTFGGKPCIIAPSIAPVHYFEDPEADDVTALELEDPAITFHTWNEGKPLITHMKRIKPYHRIDWKLIKAKQK